MKQSTYFRDNFSTKAEQNVVASKPELLELYQSVLNFDYWYQYSDSGDVYRAGARHEEEIKNKLHDLLGTPEYKLLQTLWVANGDKESIADLKNPYEEYLTIYNSKIMNNYRYLEYLDRMSVTEDQLRRALRAARFVNRYVLKRCKAGYTDFSSYPRFLCYTKELGLKNIGSKYKNKIQLNPECQHTLAHYCRQVEMYDMECFGTMTPYAGVIETDQFLVDQNHKSERYAYIGNVHFKVAEVVKTKLPKEITRSDIMFLRDLYDVLAGRVQPYMTNRVSDIFEA